MLIRYGPNALGEREYQRLLRRELRSYAWLHTRRRIKPSGRRDAEFKAFHRRELERIGSEAGSDGAVRRALAVTSLLVG